jgi:murein DD-endopeptidase MepM/ murein hydrolase activator NlpD
MLFLLQACSTTGYYSINSYKETNKEIQTNYKLSRADLILTYDLARLDNSNCIYSQILGLVANERTYAKKYLLKFKSKYKSEAHLKKEARKKINKICKLLIKLQSKHRVLSARNEQYVKKLLQADLTKLDLRAELSKLDHIASHLPLMLPVYKACLSSPYGNRLHPIKKKRVFHCGTDIVGRHKAPVYSSAYGKVTFAGMQNGYGVVVEVDHGNGIKTKYTHLSKIYVRKGRKVIRGEIIGLQGKTGHTVGEHLHFEVHITGLHVNPYDFIGHNYDCGGK